MKQIQRYDRVLVRDDDYDRWKIDLYLSYDSRNDYPYMCLHSFRSRYCIPYEGNEELLGTMRDIKDKY